MNRYILLCLCCLFATLLSSAQSMDELNQKEAELRIRLEELESSGDSAEFYNCYFELYACLMEQNNIVRASILEKIDNTFYPDKRNLIKEKARVEYDVMWEHGKDVISYAILGDSCLFVKSDTIVAVQNYIKADSVAMIYMRYLSDDEIETMANVNYSLGWYYNSGSSVVPDKKKALYYFLRAAHLGHSEAMATVGDICRFDTILPRRLLLPYWYVENYHQANAIYWYSKASEKGHIGAQCALTGCYYEANEPDSVILWGTKEGCKDSTDIQLLVGLAYFNKSEYENAVPWLEKVAVKKNALANWLLACLNENVFNDSIRSLKYLQDAADLGSPYALNDMGVRYLDGKKHERDFNTAVRYFQQAADKGCKEAWLNLGIAYYGKKYGHKDRALAVSYWEKGAKAGDSDCQYIYGCLLKKGKGVKKDKQEAVRWFKLAAQNGSEDAKKYLKKMDIEYEKPAEYNYEQPAIEPQGFSKKVRVTGVDGIGITFEEE